MAPPCRLIQNSSWIKWMMSRHGVSAIRIPFEGAPLSTYRDRTQEWSIECGIQFCLDKWIKASFELKFKGNKI